ncbi:unnamed protein product [Hapterophycus canaliculatus]
MSSLAFSTPPFPLGGTAPPALLHSSSPAPWAVRCVPPRARVRRRPSFRVLSAAQLPDADKTAEESYFERQAARKTFADDVQTSIREKQLQEQLQQAAALRKVFSVDDDGSAKQQVSSSIRDVRARNRERLKKLSQQPSAAAAASGGGGQRGSPHQRQLQQRRQTAGAGTGLSRETSMRQGKLLFTVKQMSNRRDFGTVLGMLREAERLESGATLKMYSCCIGYMGKGGNWEGALDILDRMHVSGKKPDAFCINDGMNACKKAGKYEKALWVFEQARDVWGTQLDSYVYNSAITVCARSNQRKKAAALLTEMLAKGLSPNVVTFSAAISATCGHDGDWRAAMQILADARGRGGGGVG